MLQPRADTPLIGVGDLLRYTGAQPRPIASSLATRLVDLNGDGVRDLDRDGLLHDRAAVAGADPGVVEPVPLLSRASQDGEVAALRQCACGCAIATSRMRRASSSSAATCTPMWPM